jgi:hypothetical protein
MQYRLGQPEFLVHIENISASHNMRFSWGLGSKTPRGETQAWAFLSIKCGGTELNIVSVLGRLLLGSKGPANPTFGRRYLPSFTSGVHFLPRNTRKERLQPLNA